MNWNTLTQCTAFEGSLLIASGELQAVAPKVKAVISRGERFPVLIFDNETSQLIEVDFRGTVRTVLARLPAPPPEPAAAGQPRGPGRPKLGVVPREVTLLPRHWEYLNRQPGGASVALRKLVEEARRVNEGKDRVRTAKESAYRFMSAMAGDEPGFEEATRALFAGDQRKFDILIGVWPPAIRDHAKKLAAAAFSHPALTAG